MTAFTGQSQDPGRDPLAQHLVDVAWVHVATAAVGAPPAEIHEATRDAVSAVLLALGSSDGWSPDQLDALAFEIDQV